MSYPLRNNLGREKMSSEKQFHTADYPSFTMLQSANKLRIIADKEQELHKPQVLVPSLIMAFTAIEAHVNELIQLYIDKRPNPSTRKYIEKQMRVAPVDGKLLLLTKYLTDKTFIWDSPVWQSFLKIKGLRDRLVHYTLQDPKDEEYKKYKGTFYKDIIHEVDSGMAKKAVETAKKVMEQLDLFYFEKSWIDYNLHVPTS